jgi:UDP-N-acetylglucosamine--N-acetylmuramyl-(pentapeptide) pyrophosphoryl-undecaprenol N-acetylglucosamine transferase
VDQAAAVMLAERELDAERLAGVLLELCSDRSRLQAMAQRARALAMPSATEHLADACVELARGVA